MTFPRNRSVNTAEYLSGNHRELIGTLGVIKATDDCLERGVIYIESGRQLVGGLVASLFGGEMEQTRVISLVSTTEEVAESGVNGVAVQEGSELAGLLDAAVLAYTKEYDAIDDALDGEVERSLV